MFVCSFEAEVANWLQNHEVIHWTFIALIIGTASNYFLEFHHDDR
jgi:hypothetical protein